MLDGLAKVVGRGVPHLSNNESSDLRGRILLSSSLHPSVTVGVSNDLVGNIGDVLLYLGVLEFTTNQSDISLERRDLNGG